MGAEVQGRGLDLDLVVVDGDDARRARLEAQLRQLGHGVEGYAHAAQVTAGDLLIVTGDQVAAACQALIRGPRSPWIVALVEAGGAAQAMAAGADDCVEPPWTPEAIQLRVTVACARHVHRAVDLDAAHAGESRLPRLTSSQLRRAEDARRTSQASLQSVLEASPDGIIVHRDGRYLFVNPAGVRQLGLSSGDELTGTAIYDRMLPSEVERVRQRIEEMMRTKEPAPVSDIEFVRADGESFVGEVASIPATYDGEPAIISMIRDVGGQRALQSQLYLSDRLATIGTLIVGVAHEINNPLSWVVGNLGLLSDEFDKQVKMRELPGHDPDAVAESRRRVRELLGRAQEGTERVRRIVRDLRRFARPDSDEQQAVDIHALLDSILEIADVQIRHRARLVRRFEARALVRGNEARLGQVFLNLLVNAGQAIEPGAARENQITVATRDLPDGRVEIEVGDTGCGIPEASLRRIFDPFFTTKPAGEGTGIGLAITHSIITAAGGEIEVESTQGEGTRFLVRLLAADEDVPSRPFRPIRAESDGHRSAQGRVLIVDDEPLIREMVCDALASERVEAVSTGREALERIAAEDWDLILCDMILPELSGLEVVAELEQVRPGALAKVVLMTGGDFANRVPRRSDGAKIRTLEKPFSIKILRALVRDATRHNKI